MVDSSESEQIVIVEIDNSQSNVFFVSVFDVLFLCCVMLGEVVVYLCSFSI